MRRIRPRGGGGAASGGGGGGGIGSGGRVAVRALVLLLLSLLVAVAAAPAPSPVAVDDAISTTTAVAPQQQQQRQQRHRALADDATADGGSSTQARPSPAPSTTTAPEPDPSDVAAAATPTRAPTSTVPTAAPTFEATDAPTPLPTAPPPVYVAMTVSLAISFPAPVDLNYKNFPNNPAAQDVVKDALTLSLPAVKRQDIDSISAVRYTGRLNELRLRVRIRALLSATGYATPALYYEALKAQFRNADRDGSLNRNLQGAATAHAVQAFEQAVVKTYTMPTTYLVNDDVVSAVDTTDVQQAGPTGVPLAVTISSVISAVLVFAGMVAFSRQRAAAFQIPRDDPAATASLTAVGTGGGGGATV